MDGPLVSDSFVIVEWTAAGGDPQPQAPVHIHHEDDEVWYVLSGRLAFRLDGEEVEAGAGEAVCARPGGRPYVLEPRQGEGALPPRDDAANQRTDRSDPYE